MTNAEVRSAEFQYSLKVILKAFRQNQPKVVRVSRLENLEASMALRAVLCIPIEEESLTRGILYLDNSYLDDAFNFLDVSMLQVLGRHTSVVMERLLDHLQIKTEWRLMAQQKDQYSEQLEREPLIARSTVMLDLLKSADRVAVSDSTMLISGETGTGKELMARRIHQKSPRKQWPLVVVDSTAITEGLVESELFGHEKGAFTGVDQRKIGKIELAHKGTLFLDEIGELPLMAQAKLLRALQEKTFFRVGGMGSLASDFRLLAATNRNLAAEVAAGRFRQDLYYRLNVIPLTVPPLRERKEDIPVLARFFFDSYTRKYARPNLNLTQEYEEELKKYSWPGNVRELKNVIERAVIMSPDDHMLLGLTEAAPRTESHLLANRPTLDELQRRYIKHIVEQTGGRVGGPGGAAEILGMKRPSLYSRMRQLGLSK